jgi:hypothetical protein
VLIGVQNFDLSQAVQQSFQCRNLIPTHLGVDASPQEEIYVRHPDTSSAEVNEDILLRLELHSYVEYREKGKEKQNAIAFASTLFVSISCHHFLT